MRNKFERRSQFLAMVGDERIRQDEKFGPPHYKRNFLAVLMSEVGEVATEVKEPSLDTAHLIDELCQVAAVACQWAELLMAQQEA